VPAEYASTVKFNSVRPRDPAYARFASFGGFKSAEAQSAKAGSGDPGLPDKNKNWIPACAGMSGLRLFYPAMRHRPYS
jgi:hypothetical protein